MLKKKMEDSDLVKLLNVLMDTQQLVVEGIVDKIVYQNLESTELPKLENISNKIVLFNVMAENSFVLEGKFSYFTKKLIKTDEDVLSVLYELLKIDISTKKKADKKYRQLFDLTFSMFLKIPKEKRKKFYNHNVFKANDEIESDNSLSLVLKYESRQDNYYHHNLHTYIIQLRNDLFEIGIKGEDNDYIELLNIIKEDLRTLFNKDVYNKKFAQGIAVYSMSIEINEQLKNKEIDYTKDIQNILGLKFFRNDFKEFKEEYYISSIRHKTIKPDLQLNNQKYLMEYYLENIIRKINYNTMMYKDNPQILSIKINDIIPLITELKEYDISFIDIDKMNKRIQKINQPTSKENSQEIDKILLYVSMELQTLAIPKIKEKKLKI